MRHVAAELARLGQAEECIEVRAVDVDLSPMLMHERAHVGDALSSYTPCVEGYVTMMAARFSLCSAHLATEVVEVDCAVAAARPATAHERACRPSPPKRRSCHGRSTE